MQVATLNPVGKTLIIHVGKKPDVQSIYYNAFKVDSASAKEVFDEFLQISEKIGVSYDNLNITEAILMRTDIVNGKRKHTVIDGYTVIRNKKK